MENQKLGNVSVDDDDDTNLSRHGQLQHCIGDIV